MLTSMYPPVKQNLFHLIKRLQSRVSVVLLVFGYDFCRETLRLKHSGTEVEVVDRFLCQTEDEVPVLGRGGIRIVPCVRMARADGCCEMEGNETGKGTGRDQLALTVKRPRARTRTFVISSSPVVQLQRTNAERAISFQSSSDLAPSRRIRPENSHRPLPRTDRLQARTSDRRY